MFVLVWFGVAWCGGGMGVVCLFWFEFVVVLVLLCCMLPFVMLFVVVVFVVCVRCCCCVPRRCGWLRVGVL